MTAWKPPSPEDWRPIVARALAEDLGTGDLTAVCLPTDPAEWFIEAQAEGVVCGVEIARSLLAEAGDCRAVVQDGDAVVPGTVVLEGIGSPALVVSRERTALNFLMHLSGIATTTRKYVRALQGTGATLLDTRKTVPGLRSLAKYAVRCGGGMNHRMGLYDAAMLKDNHIRAVGDVTAAVAKLRAAISSMTKIEVECATLEEAIAAYEAGADVLLLDNMTPEQLRAVVERLGDRVPLEASGGVTLDNLAEIGATGVHYVSTSATTMASHPLALHLEFA